MRRRGVVRAVRVGLGIVLVAGALAITTPPTTALGSAPLDQIGTTVIHSTKNDVSPPLASLADKGQGMVTDQRERPLRGLPQIATGVPDTAVQSSTVGLAAPAASSSFEGIGQGLPGFTVQYAPPDTNGAVGPSHFVQTVNVSFAVFSKSGSVLYGPVSINTLFTGFGGLCEADNDGDPSVVYDQLADRWVITQFAVTGANGTSVPYLECLAISTSGDPTGTYFRYSFPHNLFPDYPKLGLWPDAYYMSTNDFNGNTFAGASTWAFDRAKMLLGSSATAQVVRLSTAYGGLLPSSLDGKTLPPTGAPNYFVSLGTSSSLDLWKFHVDFTNPASSTLTGPASIPVAGFTKLCNGGTCVPQAGTKRTLDSLADRLMYRLAYRNFGDHESLVVTHSVNPGAGGAVRWYEIRSPGGTPSVYQQSTYAPDGQYRWMASAAMDHVGDIGIGYSLSSASIHPAIAYTGRVASDPLNTLQPETILISGTGSQTRTLSRWGDYSSMFIDPSDDCTFWYTTEYLTANGTFNWHTRVGTFKFAGCSTTLPPPPTVSAISPTSGPAAGGTAVAISGTGFSTTPSATTVAFGASAATGVSCATSTSCSATSPAGSGTVDVTVTVGGQTSATSAADTFTYTAPPTVTSVSPNTGSTLGGTSITVTGTSFAAPATVSVGGIAATAVVVVNATSITATTPAHAAGAVDVTVTVGGQTSATSAADTFTYLAPPTVTSVSPTSGPAAGGTAVAITGTGLSTAPGATTVAFGASAATGMSCASSTSCSATSPAGSGTVDVTVTVGGQTSATSAADQFTYVAAPVVTSLSQISGPVTGGTTLTVTGAGFSTTPGATAISFGTSVATGVSCSTTTSCTATSPAGAAGAVYVTATVAGATSATEAGNQFTYLPVVSSLSLTSGPATGGTTLTVTGAGFNTTPGATAIYFDANAATDVSCASATSCTATSPAASGVAGIVNVTATVAGATSATGAGNQFTYLPAITGLSVSSGAVNVNTSVTVTGAGFSTNIANNIVTFGSTTGVVLSCVSSTSCAVSSPTVMVAGPVYVTMTVLGLTSATGPVNQFAYLPAVSALSPSSGPTAGGTLVTVTGAGFNTTPGVTAVNFGASAATGVSCSTSTSCSATSPAGTSGTVYVTATIADATSTTGAGNQFTYLAAPTVSSLSPATGPAAGGTSVAIAGTGLQRTITGCCAPAAAAPSVVRFGSTRATGSCSSATACTATSPAGTGTVHVTVTAGSLAGWGSHFTGFPNCLAGSEIGVADQFGDLAASLSAVGNLAGCDEYIDQAIAIPAGTTQLSFRMFKDAGTVNAWVQVISQTGVNTELARFAPACATGVACTPETKTYDVSGYAGQTIQLRLGATTTTTAAAYFQGVTMTNGVAVGNGGFGLVSSVSGVDQFTYGPQADLSLVLGAPAVVTTNGRLNYSSVINNAGPNVATSVAFSQTLPTSVAFVSASATSGSCSGSGSTVTCALGSLSVGGSSAVTVIVTVGSEGAISSSATVTAAEPDPVGGDTSRAVATDVSVFADVPSSYWAYSWIRQLYLRGITGGCSYDSSTGERRYCPENNVTRGEMAVFLDRSMAVGQLVVTTPTFSDVATTHAFSGWIERLFAQGATDGCYFNSITGERRYCPDAYTTRGEMAEFLNRASNFGTLTVITATFSDVSTSHPFSGWIERLFSRGITGGCYNNTGTGERRYCPDGYTTRAEMAIFLIRTFP